MEVDKLLKDFGRIVTGLMNAGVIEPVIVGGELEFELTDLGRAAGASIWREAQAIEAIACRLGVA
jgi:hypothetical protein